MAAVTDNAWHHAALTSVGTSTTLYVDGVKQGASKTSTINHVALTFNQAGCRLRDHAGLVAVVRHGVEALLQGFDGRGRGLLPRPQRR
ncbi:LamG domain-containing protein [Nocardioides sp. W3-2-3]|nr:LamG domain-containing protein [Nocardioides convexus]